MKEMRRRWSKLTDLWCNVVHDGATWPIHGQYHCAKCQRTYAVPWK